MKKTSVRCPACGTVFTVRKTPHHCQCAKPPVRCTPTSSDRYLDRVIGPNR